MNAPPDHFLCPISHQPMKDPVTIASGITFDRENILAWFSTTYPATCPVTRQVIDNPNALVDNTMLKSEIQRWQGRMRGEQSPREKLPTRYKTVGGLARGATHKRLSGDDTLIPQDSVKSLEHSGLSSQHQYHSVPSSIHTSPFHAAGVGVAAIPTSPRARQGEGDGRRLLKRQSSSYSRLQDVEAIAARESSSREHAANRVRRRSFDSASWNETLSSERPSGTRLGTGMLDDFTVNMCLDQCLAYFALLDLTGDGFISTRDMARAQRSSLVELQMPPPVQAAVVGRFGAVDVNRDGLITRKEFVSALGGVMAAQEGLDQQAITECMLAELARRYPRDDALLAQRLAKRAARNAGGGNSARSGGGHGLDGTYLGNGGGGGGGQTNMLTAALQTLLQATSRMSQQQLTTAMHAVAYTALAFILVAYMAPGAITSVLVSAVSTTVNLSIRGLVVGMLLATVLAAGLRSGGGGGSRVGRGVAQRVQRRRS